jgi:hypothetical protein
VGLSKGAEIGAGVGTEGRGGCCLVLADLVVVAGMLA